MGLTADETQRKKRISELEDQREKNIMMQGNKRMKNKLGEGYTGNSATIQHPCNWSPRKREDRMGKKKHYSKKQQNFSKLMKYMNSQTQEAL